MNVLQVEALVSLRAHLRREMAGFRGPPVPSGDAMILILWRCTLHALSQAGRTLNGLPERGGTAGDVESGGRFTAHTVREAAGRERSLSNPTTYSGPWALKAQKETHTSTVGSRETRGLRRVLSCEVRRSTPRTHVPFATSQVAARSSEGRREDDGAAAGRPPQQADRRGVREHGGDGGGRAGQPSHPEAADRGRQ